MVPSSFGGVSDRPPVSSETNQNNKKGAYLMHFMARRDILVGALAGIALVVGSFTAALPISRTEALGFLTGAVSVWLVVKASVWTWPVGIANNVFFALLFLDARLYADMALQGLYVVLSLWAIWVWLRRDGAGARLAIARVGRGEALGLCVLSAVATGALTLYLRRIEDSAPFLDALTTCGSVAATYLLARKLVESWLVWIAVDLVYVPLYLSRELPAHRAPLRRLSRNVHPRARGVDAGLAATEGRSRGHVSCLSASRAGS